MMQSIVKHWWVLLVRGVLGVLFGCLAFARPDITLTALVALFGAYALVDGVISLVAAPALVDTRYFWWLLLDGLLGIVVGVLTFAYPGVAAASLVLLLGAWLLVGGMFRIGLAIELRKEIDNEWALVFSGLLSMAAGALTLYRPGQGALAWLWVMGVYAIVYGVMMIALSFRVRGMSGDAIRADAVLNR